MKGYRQGRFNSNYRRGCPEINILHKEEWDQLMVCSEDEIHPLLLKFDREYRNGVYPSRLNLTVMRAKIDEARKKLKSAEL